MGAGGRKDGGVGSARPAVARDGGVWGRVVARHAHAACAPWRPAAPESYVCNFGQSVDFVSLKIPSLFCPLGKLLPPPLP